MRLHCQLPADVMVKLYYSLVYSHLTYALLSWGRSGRTNAAKIECAHRRARKLLTDYNHGILTFHSIYDYFPLLTAFNTNTLNLNQYFKDKLYFHQPSHMHNTRHSTKAMLPYTGLIQYYQITCQPVNQAICIFITVPIVLCNLVSIKCIIVLLYLCRRFLTLVQFHT